MRNRKDWAKKTAKKYFDMMVSLEKQPSMKKAMLEAGYSKSMARGASKRISESKEFKDEIDRLKLEEYDTVHELRKVRMNAIVALNAKNLKKERVRDLASILHTVDERIRLLEGKSTQNISFAAIIAEIEAQEQREKKSQGDKNNPELVFSNPKMSPEIDFQ